MQYNIFDAGMDFKKITKPIRLIELFAGYGSQHFALEYLGADFESYKILEWAVKSIQAYKDAHFGYDDTDYSTGKSKSYLIDHLFAKGISADYNNPMTREQIYRMGEQKIRRCYNNIIATHNLVSVCNVKGEDLGIVDTDKYEYIMTYSFPCQDLSKAGFRKGMQKGSETRSGLLWEVERIISECKEKPQILLMENVPDVIGAKNIQDFNSWVNRLRDWGYKCYWKVLNAKNYGVPQSRERCFMVSILDNYCYEFPAGKPLDKVLRDLLDDNVDEKYYLSEKMVENMLSTSFKKRNEYGKKIRKQYEDGSINESKHKMTDLVPREDGLSNTLTTVTKDNLLLQTEYVYDVYNKTIKKDICGTITTKGNTSIRHSGTFLVSSNSKNRVRRLTPRECFRLMGVKDEDFDRISVNQSDSSLYHLAGDSIVVDVLKSILGEMIC